MFYDLMINPRVINFAPITPVYTKLVSEQVSKDGRLSRVSSFKKFSTADVLGKFTADDFSLNHILSVGALDMLKPVYAPDTSPLYVSNQVQSELNTVINEISKEQK